MTIIATFRNIWRRIELRAIYLVLFAFVVTNWVMVFFPQLRPYLTANVGTAVFATLILAVFRLFEQRLGHHDIEAFGRSFLSASDSIVSAGSHIETLDLWVHSGSKYFSVITNKNVHVSRMRLLVAAIDPNSKAPSILGNENSKDEARQERDYTLRQWSKLVEKGAIKKLEVREYAFMSQFHFMIVNDESAQFGFFLLPDKKSGSRVPKNFAIRSREGIGNEILNDLSAMFEDVFNHHSNSVSIERLSPNIRKSD